MNYPFKIKSLVKHYFQNLYWKFPEVISFYKRNWFVSQYSNFDASIVQFHQELLECFHQIQRWTILLNYYIVFNPYPNPSST